LYCEPGGESLVTQFDKDDVEQVGLVKFDFLGLRTLTIIDWAMAGVNRRRAEQGQEPLDISRIDLRDEASFRLLKSAETTAVFQLESRGMKELIKKLQPDSFDDITALVALFRPGPLQSGMVDDFINRKHGRARVEYPHPDLEPILKPTYGVILYQEQVMQIAQVLAGYTLGGADLLRRAMGKKKAEEMAKQRRIFVEGATERGVEERTATYIFDLMEKFAGYGFNKSHSAAYALVSYQTLWLKAHYPAAFMAAVLSSDMDNTDKVVTFIDECRSMGLAVEPPDVNRSDYQFTVADEGTVVYGLGAIKGVGLGAIEGLIAARGEGGPFRDLFELCRRIDLRKANRRVMETLVRSGALDRLGPNRRTLMMQLPLALKMAEQHAENQTAGQNDLFGGGTEPAAPDLQVIPQEGEEWEEDQRLQGERDTLGLYLTGHPIDRYDAELGAVVSSRIGSLELAEEERRYGGRQRAVVAGLVVSVRQSQTQRGRMGSVVLDDGTGRIEATLFSEIYEAHRDLLAQDRILVVAGTLAYDEYRGGLSLRADQVYEFEQAREAYASRLHLRLGAEWLAAQGLDAGTFAERLAETLSPFLGGPCPLTLSYRGRGASADLVLGDAWRVHPHDELLHRLARFLGLERVAVDYDRRRAGGSG
ncbi:MAG: DNA polymerase III subunit alpha, partial [Chromatiales bacterium]